MLREATITTQLAGTLAAFPPAWLAGGFSNLLGRSQRFNDCRVVKYVIEPNFLEPDLLILDNKHLLMVEGKTHNRGKESYQFPPKQVIRYALLPVYRQQLQDVDLPTEFSLLILAPGDWRDWLGQHSDWVTGVDEAGGGRVAINPAKCMEFGANNRRVARYRTEVLSILGSISIYYRTWRQLADAFTLLLDLHREDPYTHHWERLIGELNLLEMKGIGQAGYGSGSLRPLDG